MNTHQTLVPVKRWLAAVLAASLFVIGLSASPAAAAPPVTFTDTFTDMNPCSGEAIQVTINLAATIRLFSNGNEVVHVVRTGSTSDGYTMKGVESFNFNGQVARGNFSDNWKAAGEPSWRVSGTFVDNLNKGELVVDRFEFKCNGG